MGGGHKESNSRVRVVGTLREFLKALKKAFIEYFVKSPTVHMVLLNVLVYIWAAHKSGNFIFISDRLLEAYGQVNEAVYEGEIWRLFTAMFLHVHIFHIALNMVFLLIYGLHTEEELGYVFYVTLYVLSGLAGNLLSLSLGPKVCTVGASGCVFGILGSASVLAGFEEESLIVMVVYAVLQALTSSGPGINALAHLGGLALGLVYTIILQMQKS